MIFLSLYAGFGSAMGILVFPILVCMPIIALFDIPWNHNNNLNQNALQLSMVNQQYLQNKMAKFINYTGDTNRRSRST